jgi:hypothetical protein
MEVAAALAMMGLFSIGLWIGVLHVLAYLSGWKRLAQVYPLTTPLPNGGTVVTLPYARLKGVGYRRVIRAAEGPTGLVLLLPGLFRIGHPPLFIPWSALEAEPTLSQSAGQRHRKGLSELLSGLGIVERYERVRFRGVPEVSMLVPAEVAQRWFAMANQGKTE